MNIVKTNSIISKISNNIISSVVSLYMYTLGSLLMGFSIYLMLQTTNDENTLTTWSGQAMFWSLIIFFMALFILFFPIEFLNYPVLKNSNFSDLVVNIFIVIFFSAFLLISTQLFIPSDNSIFIELKAITRAVSFSGFITIPIVLFILQNFGSKLALVKNYSFSVVLLIWILSSQLFI